MDTYIFGYGSLVNNESRFDTLKKHTHSICVIVHKDFGYIRKWNVYNSQNKTVSLGLEKTSGGDYINGILFKVDKTDIDHLDDREVGYTKIQIQNKFIIFTETPIYGEIIVYTYIPRKSYIIHNIPDNNRLNTVYLDKCRRGFLLHGRHFYHLFVHFTYDWEIYWKSI